MISYEQERDKYHRMWTLVPGYRSHSPGERLVTKFVTTADWQPGETLIDLGCGTGRASVMLADHGLNVTMLDITGDCLDKPVRGAANRLRIPFVEANLWDIGVRAEIFDWLYCCDVLEHIPTEYVDAVLDNAQAITGKGAFFQIALWPDGFGDRIGETLHLTVKPVAWWRARIEPRWNILQCDMSDDGRLIVLTGKSK